MIAEIWKLYLVTTFSAFWGCDCRRKILKLYENIVIGNYLFDLGVRMAKLSPDLPLVSVSLLQQTPVDRTLADVLLQNAGVCRLMEFKRAGKLTSKERKKLAALKRGIAECGNPEYGEEISRQIHWFVEIAEPRIIGQTVVARACPYLDFSDDPDFVSLNEFAGEAAEEACDHEKDPELRKAWVMYLKWVCRTFGEIEKQDKAAKGAAGRRSSSSTAFMVAVSEDGETRWLAVPNIAYGNMNKIELAEALKLEIKPDTPRHEEKLGYGYGMSM